MWLLLVEMLSVRSLYPEQCQKVGFWSLAQCGMIVEKWHLTLIMVMLDALCLSPCQKEDAFHFVRNVGHRFVSSWHDCWQQSSCCSSLCPSLSFSHVFFVFFCQFFSCHFLVFILFYGLYSSLVGRSRSMCPMKRLLFVATMSCNVACIVRDVITPWNPQDPLKATTVKHINHLGSFCCCLPCFTGVSHCWYNGRV